MLPTDSLYILMFGSGLLGGFGHCIGMCGPVVTAYALNSNERRYIPHFLYSAGRITTYSLVGGIMGLTGSFVGVAESMHRFQNILMAATGLLMILMGIASAGWLPGLKKLESKNPLSKITINFLRHIRNAGGAGVFFPLGLVLGFLPCGLLYTAFIAAAGAGIEAGDIEAGDQVRGFLSGMSMLFLFGLGTVPAMFILGKIVSLAGERLRGIFYKTSALLMISAGIIFIVRAFGR